MSAGLGDAGRDRLFDMTLRPARIEAFHLSAPLVRPRRNAFGEMTTRPALIVRMIDDDGTEGWGECFCNWPPFGAAHRKLLIERIMAPLLTSTPFDRPEALSAHLADRTCSLCIQCNEPGPFEQAIAALDIAAWDLVARRAGLPLAILLGGEPGPHRIPVYASALVEANLDDVVPASLDKGIGAFKLKVGFGAETDLRALTRLREMTDGEAGLMVDANQAWDLDEAGRMIDRLAAFRLEWIEEPISAASGLDVWQALAEGRQTPLAAGENVRGEKGFDAMIASQAVQVLQPDVIKWGGISGCRAVAEKALAAGRRFCPHYLGGGIGLMASAHLLASMASGDLMEFDVSENPWIDVLAGDGASIEGGLLALDASPGLGVTPNLDRLDPFLVRA